VREGEEQHVNLAQPRVIGTEQRPVRHRDEMGVHLTQQAAGVAAGADPGDLEIRMPPEQPQQLATRVATRAENGRPPTHAA